MGGGEAGPWPWSILAPLLQKCLQSKALMQGKQVHAADIVTGANTHTSSLTPNLIAFYASCGDLRPARLLFNTTPTPTIFTINWMILASTFSTTTTNSKKEPFTYFSSSSSSSSSDKTRPNSHTFTSILKTCARFNSFTETQQLHSLLTHHGFLTTTSVLNSLLHSYSKSGSLLHARHVFDEMLPFRDITSWTSLISAYSAHNPSSSLLLFHKMKLHSSLPPNRFTLTSLISSAARSGDVPAARLLLSQMADQDIPCDLPTWNALISGFSRGRSPARAVEAFRRMREHGAAPNHVTIAALAPALASSGDVLTARALHCLAVRTNLHESVFVSSALVDMYSKCGGWRYAEGVFYSSVVKNTAAWNAMIGCYGRHGRGEKAVEMFERMERGEEGVDERTVTSVLSACSHGGMEEEGVGIVKRMGEKVMRGVHYGCLVDMFCRSGRMEEAYGLLRRRREMKEEDGLLVRRGMEGSFFNGCCLHGRKDMAEAVVGEKGGMREMSVGDFVTISNLHAAGGEWGDVERMRLVIKSDGAVDNKKIPAFSRLD